MTGNNHNKVSDQGASDHGHNHHGETLWPRIVLVDIRYLYVDILKLWAVVTILVLFSQVMGMDFNV